MRIVNLTGHELLLGDATYQVAYGSRGRIRLDTKYVQAETIPLQDMYGRKTGVEIPVLELANGETTSLPEPLENVLYVVSGLVAGRVRRSDIVAPARLHKEDGKTQYARALLRYGKDG